MAASHYEDFCPPAGPGDAPPVEPKQKKKRGRGPLPVVELRDGRTSVDASMANADAWSESCTLVVQGRTFAVRVNPPTVETLTTSHSYPMAGYPVRARSTVAFGADRHTRYTWHLGPVAGGRGDDGTAHEVGPVVGSGSEYVPRSSDVGAVLYVCATPGDGFATGGVRCEEVGAVRGGPARKTAPERHALTAARLQAPGLRVVTYNILADQYASTEHAKSHLFSYCDPEALGGAYRLQLVAEELAGYRADVVGLQECDEKAFPVLAEHLGAEAGLEGAFAPKAGSVREGCATLWSRERFEAVEVSTLPMRDLAEGDPESWASWERYPAVRELVGAHRHLRKVLSKVTTVLQMVLLRPRTSADRPLLVGNTHLFFHPRASHVRTLHAFVMADQLRAAAWRAVESGAVSERPAIVWCGDFNADLNDGLPGVAEMLQYGSVTADFWDWKDVGAFSWDRDEEEEGKEEGGGGQEPAGGGATGDGPMGGRAACPGPHPPGKVPGGGSFGDEFEDGKLRPGFPPGAVISAPLGERLGADLESPVRLFAAGGMRAPWTNYVGGYRGLLDYVWLDRSLLREVREIPLPSEAEVTEETALPSRRFPSDHLAVVFDLAWAGGGSGGPAVLQLGDATLPAGASALSMGELVGLPTETVYGIAGDARSEEAVGRVRAAKGRGASAPLSVAVGSVGQVHDVCDVPEGVDAVLRLLLPGSVTVVLPVRAGSGLAPGVAGAREGRETVGCRVPEHVQTRRFLRAYGAPVVLTSANLSGQAAARSAEDCRGLWGEMRVVYVEGAGAPAPAGESSTVVDLSEPGRFRVLREGAVCVSALLESAGLVRAN